MSRIIRFMTYIFQGQTDGGMKLKDLTVTSIHKVNEGDDFTLSCTATGAPEPIIEW